MQMQNFANSDPDTKNTEIVRLKNLHMNLYNIKKRFFLNVYRQTNIHFS